MRAWQTTAAALIFATLLQPSAASASCNQIPGTTNFFRGARGSLDRPFAGPGDLVTIDLSPACDVDSPGFDVDTTAQVITLVFTPESSPKRVVVMAADCAALENERQRCSTRSDVASVTCLQTDAAQSSLLVADAHHLRFRFPNTDALVDAVSDEHTLAGPATIAVSRVNDPLPCDLASTPCKDRPGLAACIDTLFTIDGTCGTTPDATFGHFTALPPANDYQALCTDPIPPCTGRASEFRFTVDAEGNILIPMDWRGILLGPSVPIARLLRTTFAVEAFPGSGKPIHLLGNAFLSSYSPEGGLLPPIFEPQTDASAENELVLFGTADAPATVLRLARRSPAFRECQGGSDAGMPCTEDGQCGAAACGPAHCVGGADPGDSCRTDDDCPGGECGSANFDFAKCATEAGGPIVIPRFGAGVCQDSGRACADDAGCNGSRCVAYRVAAKDPVPLEGLIESKSLFVSVVPEAIDGRDLNGDGDSTDDVLLLANRQSGEAAAIGEGSARGRAATRLRQEPFSYPAVVADGDVVAFLEAEPLQGNEDVNGDDDHFDTILRVYQQNEMATQELTAGLQLAIEASPVIDGRSVAITNGLVFFRQRESASAPRRITRVSVNTSGDAANNLSQRPSLSQDGHHVAFESSATNLAAPPARGTQPTTFVHDLRIQRTLQVVLPNDAIVADQPVRSPWTSGDGRYIAVSAMATNGMRQVVIYDRDRDADGIFDEPDAIGARIMSVRDNPPGDPDIAANGDSDFPSMSADGRFLTFPSRDRYLWWANETPFGALFESDRDPQGIGIFDVSPRFGPGKVASRNSLGSIGYHELLQAAAISGNGRFIAFTSFDRNLPPRDDNDFCLNFGISGANGVTCADVLLRDSATQTTLLQSVSSTGEQANNHSLSPAISDDGHSIAFESAATNLVAGDTNSVFDVFVRDRDSQTTRRASVASNGEQGNGPSFSQAVSVSRDGRFVAFASRASNLVADDTNDTCPADDGGRENCTDIFIHDRLTGFTQRISATAAGGQSNGRSSYPSLSGDGLTVAFESSASTLVPGSSNCGDAMCNAILVAAPSDSAVNDLNGDGDIDDTVLEVFDTHHPETGATVIAPADAVAVANDRVVFLVPETAAGADLNGDGDTEDLVVHLYQDGQTINLQRSAVDLALSDRVIAVRTSEAAENKTDLNGDDDTKDLVVAVYDFGANSWSNLGRAADPHLASVGANVVFRASDDRRLEVYSAATHQLTSTGQVVDEFVVGPSLVAFRTSEALQGGSDLNADGDASDHVLQILDLHTGNVINTAQAAIPCRLAACDPRLPYRVFANSVKFLTLEREQGEDLNGDGDSTDLVLQTFNVPLAQQSLRTARAHTDRALSMRASRTKRSAQALRAGALTTIGAVSAGVCTDSGHACATAADCNGAKCFVPPGSCIEKLTQSCDTLLGDAACGAGAFCVPTFVPGKGACHARRGACAGDADCRAPARCQDAGASLQQLVGPLSTTNGQEVFIAACDASNGPCTDPLVVAAAGDADGDGIADPFDNCARLANPDQRDANQNGVGDVCESVEHTPSPSPSPTIAVATRTATISDPTPSPTASAHKSNDGCTLNTGPATQSYAWVLLVIAYALLRSRRATNA